MNWKLYTDIEFDSAQNKDLLQIQCTGCNKVVDRSKLSIIRSLNTGVTELYCTAPCAAKRSPKVNHSIPTVCCNCQLKISVRYAPYSRSKTKRFYCSKSCAGTYNSTHKTHGTRRSKLEAWLESQLTTLYPNLEIYFNRKDAINSELDIYIPSLKLAFELNGIYHYEPIHGPDQLQKIQNNDNRKFQACLKQAIELCIIDSSKSGSFSEKRSKQYLDIIINVITSKLTTMPASL